MIEPIQATAGDLPADSDGARAFWADPERVERWAASYVGPETPANHRVRARQRAVAALLEGVPAGRTLDLGCGTGALGASLSPTRYVGLDASPAMLARAEPRPDARYLRADAGALPFAEDSFDVVTAIGLVGFVPDPRRLVAEVGRVLRPGGHFLAQGHQLDWFSARSPRTAGAVGPESPWPAASLDALVEEQPFHRLGFVHCDLRLLPARLGRHWPRLALSLSTLCSTPGRAWPARFAASYIAKYQRA